MLKKLLFVSLFLIPAFTLNAQNWKLVWSDEFDGSAIDQTKWVFEQGNNNGWGNQERQYYTSRAQNAYLENGSLVIKAIKEIYSGYDYTSARMKTQGKFSVKYGKIEARMKLPYGQGIWPAFWMLGTNITSVGWPACGEIDIMELIGGSGARDRTAYGTAHWDEGGHKQRGGNYALPSGKYADDYHIFALEWDESRLMWYVDGVPYFVTSTTPAAMSELQGNHFILLNLAVGGVWPGYPDATTVFPQMMYVDYVRVYKDDTTSDVKESGKSQPGNFSLNQNYPNPFNPSTVINYNMHKAGYVNLKVYDVMGKEISDLVSREMPEGSHSIRFDSSSFSGGVYFYTLAVKPLDGSKDYFEVRKMTLLR